MNILSRWWYADRTALLDVHDYLSSLFWRPDVNSVEGSDFSPIILSHLPDLKINQEMYRILKECNWNISVLSYEDSRFFHIFRRMVTEVPYLPFCWSDQDSCKTIDNIQKVISEQVSLQELVIVEEEGTLRDREIPGWFRKEKTKYDDVKTEAFYRSILGKPSSIRKVSVNFPITNNVLRAITSKPDLTSFHLSAGSPNPKYRESFAPPVVDLSHTNEIVTCIMQLKQLHHLTLMNCNLAIQHVNTLIQELPLIRELNLSHNRIENDAFSLFSSFIHLDSLDLRDNPLTTEGIVQLDVMRKLKKLSLPDSIQSDGHLVETLLSKIPNIEILDAIYSSFDAAEIELFKNVPNLKELRIGYSANSSAFHNAIEDLSKAKPDLDIKTCYIGPIFND